MPEKPSPDRLAAVASIVELPVDTRPRSRDPEAVTQRIEERLKALRAQRRAQSLAGEQTRPETEGLSTDDPHHRWIAGSGADWRRRAKLRLQLVSWEGPGPHESPIAFSTDQLERLGEPFMAAAEYGDFAAVMVFLEEGFPVNHQDPATGETALHVAAASRARRVVAALLATERCDVLIRDRQGRLASELAYIDGDDPALARLLRTEERRQAQARGITVTRRPR